MKPIISTLSAALTLAILLFAAPSPVEAGDRSYGRHDGGSWSKSNSGQSLMPAYRYDGRHGHSYRYRYGDRHRHTHGKGHHKGRGKRHYAKPVGGCHRMVHPGYGRHGPARISSLLCYDRHGRAYIKPGSSYFLAPLHGGRGFGFYWR